MQSTSAAIWIAALFLCACQEEDPVVRAGGGLSVAPEASAATTFGEVPDFRLQSQLGTWVGREDLLGRAYAVAAVFTTCIGPCPRISSEMQGLQRELEGSGALLVSVSVDPEYDSPEVLRRYAEGYGADPERWLFLTGEEESVYRFVREGLKLGVQRALEGEVPIGQQVTHGTQIVAVDKRGRIRGWYDSQTDEGVAGLRKRMVFLASEQKR